MHVVGNARAGTLRRFPRLQARVKPRLAQEMLEEASCRVQETPSPRVSHLKSITSALSFMEHTHAV